MEPVLSDYENDAFEIARRVLESYGHGSKDEQVNDLGQRIHKAAADIANERVQEAIDVADTPSGPDVYPFGSLQ